MEFMKWILKVKRMLSVIQVVLTQWSLYSQERVEQNMLTYKTYAFYTQTVNLSIITIVGYLVDKIQHGVSLKLTVHKYNRVKNIQILLD